MTGLIAAEVFIVGLILAGTPVDFKEAERLPGELAASLEAVADECVIIDDEPKLPEARQCGAQPVGIEESDELTTAYLDVRHDAWFARVTASVKDVEDPAARILAVFDAIGDYVGVQGFAVQNLSTLPPKRGQ